MNLNFALNWWFQQNWIIVFNISIFKFYYYIKKVNSVLVLTSPCLEMQWRMIVTWILIIISVYEDGERFGNAARTSVGPQLTSERLLFRRK